MNENTKFIIGLQACDIAIYCTTFIKSYDQDRAVFIANVVSGKITRNYCFPNPALFGYNRFIVISGDSVNITSNIKEARDTPNDFVFDLIDNRILKNICGPPGDKLIIPKTFHWRDIDINKKLR